MTDRERALTAALAAADRQLALANDTLDMTIEQALKLLTEHGDTEAWAILGTRIAKDLGCTTKHQQFAVEMLAAAAIRLVQNS